MTSVPDTDRSDSPADPLTRARRRNATLKARVAKQREALQAQRRELEALREFTLDVFREHRVPDDLGARIARLKDEGLTYLTTAQVHSLAACVLEADAAQRPGILIEAGTARGGSAIAVALAKQASRPLHVHDVFGMIPPPTDEDGADVHDRYADIVAGNASPRDGETYYGYRDDLLGEVTESFARHGVPVGEHAVHLHQGLFEDTIVGDEPVALAHVDGDWYASTMVCLERITPRLVPGGRIVIDDYYSWSGCRDAVDGFFADRKGFRVEMRAKVHIVKE